MTPSPGRRLFLATPTLLGPVPLADAPADDCPAWALAWAPSSLGPVAVRTGARVVGTAPIFPSAALVVSLEEDGVWLDVAVADEPPDATVSRATLAIAGDLVTIAYRRAGASDVRQIQFSLKEACTVHSTWRRLPDYPQAPGMAGIMAGHSNGAIIAAGGANFPGPPPWEGGIKLYYDEIYVLEPGAHQWRPAGKLPAPRAYAATVSTPDGVLLLGGEDGKEVFRDTLLLAWNGSSVEITTHAPLPEPITAAVAAILDGQVYLAGGYPAGTPRLTGRCFWRLPLQAADAVWEVLPSWDGPSRAQGTAAAVGGAFYLISGLELKPDGAAVAPAVYLADAHRFTPGRGWEKLPDLPWSAIAAPSPAPVTADPAQVFVLGGVDGRQVGHLPRAIALPNDILVFDVARHAWRLQPEPWPMPVVCTPAIELADEWILPSGESMAGKRTTQVWSWRIAR